MAEEHDIQENDGDTSSNVGAARLFLAGILFGSATTLLLAPHSGKKTRRQIQRKVRNFRKQTARAVDDGADQARDKALDVSTSIHEHAEELLQQLGPNRR